MGGLVREQGEGLRGRGAGRIESRRTEVRMDEDRKGVYPRSTSKDGDIAWSDGRTGMA